MDAHEQVLAFMGISRSKAIMFKRLSRINFHFSKYVLVSLLPSAERIKRSSLPDLCNQKSDARIVPRPSPLKPICAFSLRDELIVMHTAPLH